MRPAFFTLFPDDLKFQSTHSLRSATVRKGATLKIESSFNPRTPCGVRPFQTLWTKHGKKFQSTHSLRSATCLRPVKYLDNPVSIHALLAECDRCTHAGRTQNDRFQSTHSLRSATKYDGLTLVLYMFQSTHSLRSATNQPTQMNESTKVSIHALLAECDLPSITAPSISGGFNPRTPCGVRPRNRPIEGPNQQFQSTHSLRSATGRYMAPSTDDAVSIHALLAECDR